MRTLLAICLAGVLAVGTAEGQVRIFLDAAGVGEQEDRGTLDPLSYENPVVAQNTLTRLYIYGEFLSADAYWIAVNFDVTSDGDTTLSDPSMYAHRTEYGPRWSTAGSGLNSPTNASFRGAWVGNPEIIGGIWNVYPDADIKDPRHYRRDWDSQGGGLGTTLLGYIDVEGTDGSLWMTVEPPIFARLGGNSQDPVHFGYGDDPVTAGGIGIRTDIAEATIVPEPAGLLLLGLGAVALLRRR